MAQSVDFHIKIIILYCIERPKKVIFPIDHTNCIFAISLKFLCSSTAIDCPAFDILHTDPRFDLSPKHQKTL